MAEIPVSPSLTGPLRATIKNLQEAAQQTAQVGAALVQLQAQAVKVGQAFLSAQEIVNEKIGQAMVASGVDPARYEGYDPEKGTFTVKD